MAAADPVGNVIFPSEMNSGDSWDATVPYPAPISIPESTNILAELSMYASAMNTPVRLSDNAPSASSEETDDGLFRTGPTKQGMKRSLSPLSKPLNKKAKVGKTEYGFITEPVTPSTRSRPAPFSVSKIPVPAPMSPATHSLCTDEADEVMSMPPTPIPADLSCLPHLSKEQTAKRRALRRAALKRSRSRKEEGITLPKMELSIKSEGEMSQTGEPVDKKAARAIRNREAAMKSRVEAKQKMRKLQDENDNLNVKVKSLTTENLELTSQLKNLLQHTLGVQVAEGQDVKQVFNAFARITNQQ